ncbi:hypothetical protein BJX63DRAFT_432407 [Aspergillus granulosus]|uniref:MARVEL domain-containing protein n=1 Tax=Aspergillus granulosus TaxID=176169 RepID=A0ABR4HB68_9EURO
MNANIIFPSPYYANDRHKALLSLRVLSILTSLSAFHILAWATPAHMMLATTVLVGALRLVLSLLTVLTFRYGLNIPVHPGIYMAFDFIAVGLLAGWTIVMVLLIEPFSNLSYSCANGDHPSGGLLAKLE